MQECLDMTIRVTCENDEEAKRIEKELVMFKRRIKHIKNKEINCETTVVNLQSGKAQITVSRRNPRD